MQHWLIILLFFLTIFSPCQGSQSRINLPSWLFNGRKHPAPGQGRARRRMHVVIASFWDVVIAP